MFNWACLQKHHLLVILQKLWLKVLIFEGVCGNQAPLVLKGLILSPFAFILMLFAKTSPFSLFAATVVKSKGIHNRLALTICLLLDMDLALYGLFLLYEMKLFKSWSHFNVMEIQFYSNQRNNEKIVGPGRVWTCNLPGLKLTP